MRRRMLALFAAALLALTGLAACGDDDGGSEASGGEAADEPVGETVTVTAADFSFDPSDVSITAKESSTIELVNDGSVEHNITIEDLDVDVDAEAGESASANVNAGDAGQELQFFCKYHPDQMKGTLTIG